MTKEAEATEEMAEEGAGNDSGAALSRVIIYRFLAEIASCFFI